MTEPLLDDEDLKLRLRKTRDSLRKALRTLNKIEVGESWEMDEDVLDQLCLIQGQIALLDETYRTGNRLDSVSQELWLIEHGYIRPQT